LVEARPTPTCRVVAIGDDVRLRERHHDAGRHERSLWLRDTERGERPRHRPLARRARGAGRATARGTEFVGTASVDTLGEWATEIRRLTGGGAIDVEHLCHADGETEHWGTVDGERYYFRCFYDAVILAAAEERPVDVHTASPDGTVVEARAVSSGELSVGPEGAVFSLGLGTDAYERSGGDPTLQDGYASICPYVKAFPDRGAYEQWADTVPAATVAMPLAGATDVAGAPVD